MVEPETPNLSTENAVEEPASRLRILEFGLVIFVVFSQLIAVSLYVVFTRANLHGSTPGNLITISGIFSELSSLAVLRYVLFRQGRSFSSLGLRFSWKDIPKSFLVMVIAYVVFVAWWFAISQGYQLTGRTLNTAANNVDLSSMVSISGVLFLTLNPFFEELTARAFVISEVQFFTGSWWPAVLVSVVLQSSYHLYQGLVPALLTIPMFAVFSLYYIRTKRITPVILAHMLFDFLALSRG